LREELQRLSEHASEPVSFPGLVSARRRRSSRRRAGGIAVGLVAFAAAGSFLLTTFRDRQGSSPGDAVPAAWTTYTDPHGWTIEVPVGWRTRRISPPSSGARFEGAEMSVQIGIQPAPSTSLPGLTLPPGLTIPPSNDSRFPLHADQLLSNVEGGLGGHFFGDGQRFNVQVLSPSFPDPLPETDADILDRMIGSISFEPWKTGEVRHGWEAIATPNADVSWVTVRGGVYMLFRTDTGYRIYGAITCGGDPPSRTTATSDGFAVLGCSDGSTWQMDAEGSSGGGCIASANDPPPEWIVVTAHDGTLIAFVVPGYYPPGTGGSGYGDKTCGIPLSP
jgi:hypothetical protein